MDLMVYMHTPSSTSCIIYTEIFSVIWNPLTLLNRHSSFIPILLASATWTSSSWLIFLGNFSIFSRANSSDSFDITLQTRQKKFALNDSTNPHIEFNPRLFPSINTNWNFRFMIEPSTFIYTFYSTLNRLKRSWNFLPNRISHLNVLSFVTRSTLNSSALVESHSSAPAFAKPVYVYSVAATHSWVFPFSRIRQRSGRRTREVWRRARQRGDERRGRGESANRARLIATDGQWVTAQ